MATPCPPILATPIAITSGLSRVARRGVIVEGGGAIEQLARAEVMMLDTIGTDTAGRPGVLEVEALTDLGQGELVGLAASLDQVAAQVFSAQVFAPTTRKEARHRRLALSFPDDEAETARMGSAPDGSRGSRSSFA